MDDSPVPYEGPDALREPIVEALARVVDPEVALSIVDVGLVYGVTVTDAEVHVRLTMTSAACPVADMLADQVRDELAGVTPAGVAIRVELVWDPPWTPERMSEQARQFLQW
jgi:metal-sulfur cluster biosynthetic enzyme